MESPFNNYDIIKYLIKKEFKDDSHNLLKLAHTSSFLRKEIIENELYPEMIDIIKNNNIYQVKELEKKIIQKKRNKDSLITLLKNNNSNLREIERSNIDDPETIQFIKKQIKKYKININNLQEEMNNLNLRIKSLRKKNLFFNQKFIELEFYPLPRNRNNNYWYMAHTRPGHITQILVDKIKLKYIVKDDDGEYSYIENLYFNKNSNILHLTNCGSLKNSDLNNCVFVKKDNLIDHDDIDFTYCKKCTKNIINFLI